MPGWGLAALANKATRECFGVRRDDDGNDIVCTFTPYAGNTPGTAEPFTPIFDDAVTVIKYDGEQQIETTMPVADVVIADLSRAPQQGDRIAIGAVAYKVYKVEPTGNGTCKCFLTR